MEHLLCSLAYSIGWVIADRIVWVLHYSGQSETGLTPDLPLAEASRVPVTKDLKTMSDYP
jgi:hypothetical protein